jgi:hypothetical protein
MPGQIFSITCVIGSMLDSGDIRAPAKGRVIPVTNHKKGPKMKTKMLFSLIVMFAVVVAISTPPLSAQSHPEYIPLGGGVKAALYKPDSGPPPHVGILVMHRTVNFLSTTACTQLSSRGFLVLCANPSSDNNEAVVNWENTPLEVRRGVNFLKSQPGITKVLLWAHSGGGPLMTFYQAVAETGPSYCQGPNKLLECGNDLVNLIKADGIILADAHPGNPVVGNLRNVHPGVFNENRPDRVHPKLDPFDPENGFNPNGSSTYSEQFKEDYFKAQAERMNKLIDIALSKVRLIEEGKYRYPDNDSFLIPKSGSGFGSAAGSAGLHTLDVNVLCCTLNPQKFLKNDGTIVTQVVRSVRVAAPENAEGDKRFLEGTKILTLRSFLGANAIRATHSMDYNQIDWCSTNNSTVCALDHISIPMLIAGMGAHYFIRDAEFFYERAKTVDKDLIVIEGATHGFGRCIPCEQTPGQYSNATRNFFDYVRDWINARF